VDNPDGVPVVLWELMANGHLRTYAGYVPFVTCFVILVAGPVSIWLLWPWRRKDRG
jgi:hypothetical protein